MTFDPATFQFVVVGALALKLGAELCLEGLDRREILRHAGRVPEAFRGVMSEETYRKAVAYSLAGGRFSQVRLIWDALVLGIALFSGWLPALFRQFQNVLGSSAWAMAAFCALASWLISLPGLPLDWWRQFKLEQRFGFNTSTQRTWWADQAKGLALLVALMFPLLWLLFKLIEWAGAAWWIWGWAATLGFQCVLMAVYPMLIMPWFNRFTPLPEGALRERLLALSRRTDFPVRSIQVMDGSRRSRHSNAFFAGLGRFRKIVMFDTLIEQLAEPELEAVLAHEIGHYKKKHIVKMLVVSAVSLLAGFYVLGRLAVSPWFYQAFGFSVGSFAPAFVLFGLVSGLFTFWLSPIMNFASRRHEYEADAYAAEALGEPHSLIGALRKLEEKNLSNLTPHWLYSVFYYSHPKLLERERALANSPKT